MRQDDTREATWAALERHATDLRGRPLKALFAADPARAEAFTLSACGLTVDHAKHRITAETLALFESLAAAVDLVGQLEDMRAGKPVNTTENRAAMHMALRGGGGDANARAAVAQTRADLHAFAMDVAAGRRAGAGGPFNAIVHLGIGGSDLGPRLILDALKTFRRPGITVRFAANVDGAEIVDALEGLDPARTLVAVVSKTFTTQETMANADAARAWLTAAVGADAARAQTVAISAAPDLARTWGAGEVFPFWDWVGGRYSLWSAVGLTTEIALQDGAFEALLKGAAAMDAARADRAPGRQSGVPRRVRSNLQPAARRHVLRDHSVHAAPATFAVGVAAT